MQRINDRIERVIRGFAFCRGPVAASRMKEAARCRCRHAAAAATAAARAARPAPPNLPASPLCLKAVAHRSLPDKECIGTTDTKFRNTKGGYGGCCKEGGCMRCWGRGVHKGMSRKRRGVHLCSCHHQRTAPRGEWSSTRLFHICQIGSDHPDQISQRRARSDHPHAPTKSPAGSSS
jgi:hypothetical protein